MHVKISIETFSWHLHPCSLQGSTDLGPVTYSVIRRTRVIPRKACQTGERRTFRKKSGLHSFGTEVIHQLITQWMGKAQVRHARSRGRLPQSHRGALQALGVTVKRLLTDNGSACGPKLFGGGIRRWASSTRLRSRIARRPMAGPNGSSRPAFANGPVGASGPTALNVLL